MPEVRYSTTQKQSGGRKFTHNKTGQSRRPTEQTEQTPEARPGGSSGLRKNKKAIGFGRVSAIYTSCGVFARLGSLYTRAFLEEMTRNRGPSTRPTRRLTRSENPPQSQSIVGDPLGSSGHAGPVS